MTDNVSQPADPQLDEAALHARWRDMRWPARCALIGLLALGVFLRGWDLSSIPLWVDEAESAINGLTIHDHGVPIDTYLGLPIYENVLTEPWPGHPEYEFKDSSYSDRGVAIYHGWLPLYSISISEWLFGVRPDHDASARSVQHTDAEIRTRIIAARAPSVLFGLLFLVGLFATARRMYGNDAAFAALAFGAIGEPFIIAARQARYYSATLAISVTCCLFAWRIYQSGRWRDYLLAGVAFGLLFHTHLLSFMVLCATFAFVMPTALRRPGGFKRMAAMGAIVAAITLPWLLLTGFLRQAVDIPPARSLLHLPSDLLTYPLQRREFVLFAVLSLLWIVAVTFARRRLPARWVTPVLGYRLVFVYLIAWGLIGLLAFTLLVPAASYFLKRLILAVIGPGVLLTAVFAAATARAIAPRRSTVLAVAGVLVLVVAEGFLPTRWPYRSSQQTPQQELIAFLRAQDFKPDAKLYATPNEHLTMQFLLGMPVQSVAPIRREFLDRYPGEIVVIDPVTPYTPYGPWGIRQFAKSVGVQMTEKESEDWSIELCNALVRREAAKFYGDVQPPPAQLPAFLAPVLDDQQALTARLMAGGHSLVRENAAVFRGQPILHWGEWWPVFFYRFVDWRSRAGENLNYAGRAATGTAYVMKSGYVVLRSKRPVVAPPTTRPATNPS